MPYFLKHITLKFRIAYSVAILNWFNGRSVCVLSVLTIGCDLGSACDILVEALNAMEAVSDWR